MEEDFFVYPCACNTLHLSNTFNHLSLHWEKSTDLEYPLYSRHFMISLVPDIPMCDATDGLSPRRGSILTVERVCQAKGRTARIA